MRGVQRQPISHPILVRRIGRSFNRTGISGAVLLWLGSQCFKLAGGLA